MGTHGHMGYLLRAKTGMFALDDAHTIEEITAAEDLSALLVPMDRPLAHLTKVTVKPHAERFVRNGNALTVRELSMETPEGEPVRLYLGERFAGIGRMQDEQMKFEAMLLK
jgi:tRNA U55 pseudouridine synthase TruB